MSLKQKAAFGSKRVRAAAKLALAKQRKRKRNRPKAKARHRPRSKPAPRKRRRVTNSATKDPRKRRRRKNGSAKRRRAKRRTNTGALYALVNPARKKGKTSMARRKKNRRRRPAGSTRRRANTGRRRNTHHRRRNPGALGGPSQWLQLGGGAVIGGFGATALPQMVLGGSNTGPMGYLGMAASTAILATAAHFLFGKKVMLTAGVIAGGAGALIKRIIGDYTPLGQYLNANAGASGLGDYLTNWNFTTPQIIGGNGNTALGTPGSIPVSVAGAGTGAGRALMNV